MRITKEDFITGIDILKGMNMRFDFIKDAFDDDLSVLGYWVNEWIDYFKDMCDLSPDTEILEEYVLGYDNINGAEDLWDMIQPLQDET